MRHIFVMFGTPPKHPAGWGSGVGGSQRRHAKNLGKFSERRLSEWFGLRVVDEEQKELALHRVERRPDSFVVLLRSAKSG